ncbi:alpha/beta hydrolase [Haloarchaeobius sp. HRN-SO-5]|uniref:alpha/beta hydrolase n=1 Tax=Haloarchaeobius sp. HRN-SO-5 TaxID=3446118 RepID=UPI003EBD1508
MNALDPELRQAVADFPDHPRWHELGVAEARRLEDDRFSSDAVPGVETVDRRVPRDGDSHVPVRTYRPPALDRPAPALVFAHGGGFVLGTLDSADDLARRLAARTGSVVVSVDYRLAPEHPCPAAVADVAAVVEWVLEGTADLGVDPGRVGVAGSSAGANLAAMARRRVDAPGRTLAPQVLLYPMLDPDLGLPAHEEHAGAPLLTRADLEWFWRRYRDGGSIPADDGRLSPLTAGVDGDAPPTVVVTAGVDPLRDDGTTYARALSDAGVPVERLHYPAACHGFLSMAGDSTLATAAWADLAAAVLAYR